MGPEDDKNAKILESLRQNSSFAGLEQIRETGNIRGEIVMMKNLASREGADWAKIVEHWGSENPRCTEISAFKPAGLNRRSEFRRGV